MAEAANTPETISSSNSSEADLDRVCQDPDKMESQIPDADAALQRFLQQQRTDLMYELRRIEMGERPVTGQSNRQNIASFMAKHVPEPQAAGAGAEGGKNVPANVDAVEDHRPEAVVVEVQGVVEQRRVSSMLQSQGFRRQLENIIRGSIGSAVSRRTNNQSPRPTTSYAPAQAASSSPAQASSNSEQAASSPQVTSNAAPQAAHRTTVRPPTPEESRSEVSMFSDAASISSDSVDAAVPPVVRPSPRPRESIPQPVNQVPVAPWARPEEGEAGLEGGRVLDDWSQMQREDMVYEISDLLHRRLVSSTLDSEFRTMMELHIQTRLDPQADGEAVADYVRSIPQSQPHIPNDFRHLGINPHPHRQQNDNLSDNISITGISATAVPYTQTNLHLSREMHSLKSQMEEMKSMLRLTFDLQMDIQRAIRQEVAAAMASATAQGATAAAAAPTIRSTPVNDTHCLICLDNHSDSVLYQCGHMCVCFTCGKNLMTRGNGKCPVCRAPIKDIIRAYKTNVE